MAANQSLLPASDKGTTMKHLALLLSLLIATPALAVADSYYVVTAADATTQTLPLATGSNKQIISMNKSLLLTLGEI